MRVSPASSAGLALAAAHVPLLCFVELDFPDGFLRATNAGYTFTWNGYEWLGLGAIGDIEQISESVGLEAHGLGLTLSGVDGANLSTALGQVYQGRACKVWLAPLDASYNIVGTPVLVFWGRMDTMQIVLGATATIRVQAESRLIDWDRARVRRYNHEDQISEYPFDTGLTRIPQMVEKQLVWGRA